MALSGHAVLLETNQIEEVCMQAMIVTDICHDLSISWIRAN